MKEKERLEALREDEETTSYSRELSISSCLSSGDIFWDWSCSPGRWLHGRTSFHTPCGAPHLSRDPGALPRCERKNESIEILGIKARKGLLLPGFLYEGFSWDILAF